MKTVDAQWREWVAELIRDHYDRVAEDNKPYLALADTIDFAYQRGRGEARAEVERLRADLERARQRRDKWKDREGKGHERRSQLASERDSLRAALRRVIGRAREWGDFENTDFGDALREGDEVLAAQEAQE